MGDRGRARQASGVAATETQPSCGVSRMLDDGPAGGFAVYAPAGGAACAAPNHPRPGGLAALDSSAAEWLSSSMVILPSSISACQRRSGLSAGSWLNSSWVI